MSALQSFIAEMKELNDYWMNLPSGPQFPLRRQVSFKEIGKLLSALEIMEKALSFYGQHETWNPDLFLVGSNKMKDDLEETKWSRYTPGKKARQALHEVEALFKKGE